jgi:hypothetical protein
MSKYAIVHVNSRQGLLGAQQHTYTSVHHQSPFTDHRGEKTLGEGPGGPDLERGAAGRREGNGLHFGPNKLYTPSSN